MKGFRKRKGLLPVFVAVLLFIGITVYAVHDLGLFELDRNLNESGGTPGEDWSTLFNTDGTHKAGSSAVARSYVNDPFNSSADDTFTQGSSDNLPISGWHWTAGNANDKSDIKNAMVGAYVYHGASQGSCVGQPAPCKFAQNGDLILFYGLDRYANNGDGNVGFWFFKNPVSLNPDGTFSGEHAIGDLLVVSDFTNGGVISDVNGYIWVGSGGDTSGTLQKVFSGQDCDTSPAGGDLACAVVTQNGYPPFYFPYTPKFTDAGQPANTYPPGTLFEGGVNLTRFGVGQCFTTFMAQTRSSQSPVSSLQDLAMGNFDLCKVTATKAGPEKSKVGDPAHYVITLTNSGGSPLYLDDVTDSKGGVFFHDGVQSSNVVLSQNHITNFSSTCPGSNPLAAGASCTITYDYTVQAGDSDPLVNTVNVTYRASTNDVSNTGAGIQAISATAQYSTNLFQPSVAVKKCFNTLANFDDACTTTSSASLGSSVTYNFWIKNTSSSDSPNLVKDSIQDLLPNNSPHLVLAPPAACNNLAPGATCSFQVTHTVVAGDFPSVTDNFVVHYHPAGFPNDIQASTTATLTPSKVTLAIVTELHNDAGEAIVANGSSISLNSGVHDKATVSNIVDNFAPANPVVFTFFRGSVCDTDSEAAGSVALGAINAGSAVAHPSQSKTALTAGQYSFRASIAGDTIYNGATSACEPFTVNKAATSVVTVIHNGNPATDVAAGNVASVAAGSSVHDKATVSGQVGSIVIGGTVSFTWYTTADNCTGSSVSAGTVAVSGGVAHPSNTFGPLPAGARSFKAHYDGDANYAASDAACEPLTITLAASTLVTDIHDDSGTHTALPLNPDKGTRILHDSARLTTTSGQAPTGTVTFEFFNNGTCSGSAVDNSGALALTQTTTAGGSVDATGYTKNPATAGSYSFRASYSGDPANASSVAACEPFTVTTIEIRKVSNGGNESFDFTLDGASKTITTSGFVNGLSPGQGTTGALVIAAGAHTVVELSKVGWKLDSTQCTPRSGAATSPSATQNPTPQPGDAEVCVFTNTLQDGGATRTQGFWSTHTVFANEIWNTLVLGSGYDNLCGTKIITANAGTDQNILMGGFWANIANKTTNPKARTDVEKARMQMLQQYLAAVLNRFAFGTDDGGVIAAAKAGYCSNDASVVKSFIGPLGDYNTSGDTIPIDKVVGATPQESRSQADIPYWDITK